jgi:hypothetical protein
MTQILNIGLANPKTGKLNTLDEVLIVLSGFVDMGNIASIYVAQSETEPTVVVKLPKHVALSRRRAYNVAHLLDQDCIAVYNQETDEGYLVGEKSAEWGNFNPEFFIL